MSPYSVAYPTDISDLLPVVTTIAPVLLEIAISSVPRVRACRFSSVMSRGNPAKVPERISSKPFTACAVGAQRIDCNRGAQRRVDAAGYAEQDAGETILLHVITQPQHTGGIVALVA